MTTMAWFSIPPCTLCLLPECCDFGFLPQSSSHVSLQLARLHVVPGTVINENYSLMLMAHPSMNLMEAVLLDLVQRGKYIEDTALELLRKKHLIEGRRPHVYVAKMVAQKTGKKIEYSKHKGLVSKSCEAMLLEALHDHGMLTKNDITGLLWGVLSDQLTDTQKKNKIDNILRRLRSGGIIKNHTVGNRSEWTLVKK